MIISPLTQSTCITSQPIGVFDSGIGGLSIVNKITEQLPTEKIVYIADTLHAPYGDKSNEVIINRVNIIANELILRGCKIIVVACNTATVTAIKQLRESVSIPIIGVEPAIKPAALQSKNKRIAILTTQATSTNERFLTLVDKHKLDSDVFIQACPGLVELIESHQLHSTKFDDLLNFYLHQVSQKDVDTIVLGCTHYPFFADKIKQKMGKQITLMETAQPVSEQLQRQLIRYGLTNQSSQNNVTFNEHQFISSNATQQLEQLMSYFTKSTINLKSLTKQLV